MSDSTRDLAQSITDDGPVYRRLALSRAITMMESKKPQTKKQADYLLTYLLAKRPKTQEPTLRVGFAGPPGAGKSSLIEAFGMRLLKNDPKLRLAAVCIDPSSEVSGGSILGDKTRMTELSRNERAYVRPSSNSGVLGGLAAYTDDVVTTLSAAGYPLVLLETVGLGQSEVEVVQSVDVLVLLLPPAGGDAVTKADGNLLDAAKSTASDYKGALSVLQQSGSNAENVWKPPVLMTSSATNDGLDELWKAIQDYKAFLVENQRWDKLHQKQSKYWMWKQFTRLMQERMKADPDLGEKARRLERDMLHGDLTPRVAAEELLDGIFDK
eukprot:scaffold11634_cov109-Cylindrotheca_fusiformis.AAC.6